MRQTQRLFQVIALAGFLLPFLNVSCMGQKVTAPAGWQLAAGAVISIDEEFAGELDGAVLGEGTTRANAIASGESQIEPWLVGAAAALLVALVVSLFESKPRLAAVLSVLGVGAVGAYWLSISGELAELETLGFEVSPGVGLLMTGAGGIAGAAAGWAERSQADPIPRSSKDAVSDWYTPPQERPPERPSFCIQCGQRFRSEDDYCGQCGKARS